MKNIITSESKPIKLWLDDIEDGALTQAKNMANLPFIFKHIALMPDCHQGYGMPIGGVMATQGVIIPNAVGVDIGCGMCSIRTNLREIDTITLKHIMGEIRKVIPVGFNRQQKTQDSSLMPPVTPYDKYTIVMKEYDSALKQIGTLGGGNHFIEIQKCNDGYIWIMIHSGSRNIGLKVANHYNRVAQKLNEQWYSEVTKSIDLAFLPIKTKEAKDYMLEMQFCVDFALANRKLMLDNIKEVFLKVASKTVFDNFINIAHNYAKYENHFNTNVIVHRKGATSANKGELGIIPGSQGTKSYIVKGLGNKESFMSCSHGAGRKMGRKQAQRVLNLKDEISILDSQNIVHGIRNEKDLDEASGAYKDIDVVMSNQKDLIDVVVELTPLGVIKG